jgi:hypothetical protein
MSRRILLAFAVVLAGCGGGGEPSTPAGYATYESSQASFAYPQGWKPAKEGVNVRVRPSGMEGADVAPQVEYRVTRLEGTEWDSFIDQSRTVTETLVEQYKGKLSDYDVDVAGAKEVSGAEVSYTATDGKPYRALTVDALLDDGETVVALTAGGRPEDKVDLEGVVKSLDLK